MRIVDEDLKAWLETRFQRVDDRFERADGKSDDLRRHFDVVAEQNRSEIQLLAESVGTRIDQLASEIARLEEKMDRGFAESRVERLESTVH